MVAYALQIQCNYKVSYFVQTKLRVRMFLFLSDISPGMHYRSNAVRTFFFFVVVVQAMLHTCITGKRLLFLLLLFFFVLFCLDKAPHMHNR